MSSSFWRIATDTKDYTSDDKSGKGSEKTGGRWNDVGVPIIYAAESRALACLETIVHLGSGGLPLNRYLVEIIVPDDIVAAAEHADPTRLVGWDAAPAGNVSITHGSNWVRSLRTSLLYVPSTIVEEEKNILINPLHTDISRIDFVKIRKWLYDPRLI